MNSNELLELGFIDTSYSEDGIDFTEFELTKENFKIEITGTTRIEIKFKNSLDWIDIPNCKTIEDIKHLIRLFE